MDSQKTLETIKKLEFKAITDTRGFGMEILSRLVSSSIGSPEFKHIYVSFSRKGVIRGLHYQLPPKAQGKLVAVILGEIFDVVVDIRRSSNDFGKYMILKLRSGEGVWIPPGFAHGFQALDDSVVLYLMTEEFEPKLYRCIRWNDPSIRIPWPLDNHVISDKDSKCPLLAEAEIFI